MQMEDNIELSATQEGYIAAIFQIEQEHGVVRANMIAKELGVTRPTVTTALKQLSSLGLINYSPYQPITLTKLGKKQAVAIAHRNVILYLFLTETLQFPEERAKEIACRMEHAMDEDVVVQLGRLVLYLKQSNCLAENWQELYSPHGKRQDINHIFPNISRKIVDSILERNEPELSPPTHP